MWKKFVRMHDGISNLTLQVSTEIVMGRYDRQWRRISYEEIISFYFLKVSDSFQWSPVIKVKSRWEAWSPYRRYTC